MEEAQWNYPGPRGFLSPRREYQATDKEAARENLQGQILTLVQIYWRCKINQLSRVTRGFPTSSIFSLSSPLRASLIAVSGLFS